MKSFEIPVMKMWIFCSRAVKQKREKKAIKCSIIKKSQKLSRANEESLLLLQNQGRNYGATERIVFMKNMKYFIFASITDIFWYEKKRKKKKIWKRENVQWNIRKDLSSYMKCIREKLYSTILKRVKKATSSYWCWFSFESRGPVCYKKEEKKELFKNVFCAIAAKRNFNHKK